MIYALDGIAPQIDPEAWVADEATLIGKVVVGPEANIWFGAVIRGDNEEIRVGAGTNVQENAVLHTDMGYPLTIGTNCTIGHKAMLHGCTIGDGTLIGMGATVLNGAKIGKGSVVAVGSFGVSIGRRSMRAMGGFGGGRGMASGTQAPSARAPVSPTTGAVRHSRAARSAACTTARFETGRRSR